MTASPIARTAGLVLALTVAASSLAGCGDRQPSAAASAPAASRDLPPDGTLTGESIFDLDLPLVDHAGRTLKLADLGGHVMVAAMVYTSCTTICIMITEEMKQIERQLAGVDRDVRYVLFSLDPGRDTPAAMQQFAKAHELDTSRWTLYAASEEGVRDLAAVLGVKYREEENGEIAHSAMIFVIDGRGVVRHRQVGVRQDPAPLVAAVQKAR
ncbi:MAG: SCO family protein [Acidobacteria bacterium]|nr:SCO family protein [Acidobacteriota bacterium]